MNAASMCISYLYCAAVSFVLSSIGRRMGPKGGGNGDGEGGRDAKGEGMREYVYEC